MVFNYIKENLKKAYALEPGNPDVLESLGRKYMDHGEYERGILLIIQSIERRYSIKDPEYYLEWGNLYHYSGNEFEQAEVFYQQAINLAPRWVAPYYHLAQLYRYWGKYGQAEEALSCAMDIAPPDQATSDLMGWINLLMRDLEGAAGYWSQYEDLEFQFPDTSQYVPFRHRLGYVRYLQGDAASAMRLMKEQLKLDIERQQQLRGYGAWVDRGFYYDLAATNAYLGNREEALIWLDSAFQRGFVNLWYLQNDPLLRNIREAPEFQRIQQELADRQQEQARAFNKVVAENRPPTLLLFIESVPDERLMIKPLSG